MTPQEPADGTEPPDAAAPPDRPQPPRAAWLVALFVAVTWAAVVFAADGLMAVALDRDPIPAGVSPYYGLLATGVSGIAVWLAAARAPLGRTPALAALVGTAAVYLILVASGLVSGVRLMAVQATSPFTLCAAVGAGLAVIATWFGMRAWRSRGRA